MLNELHKKLHHQLGARESNLGQSPFRLLRRGCLFHLRSWLAPDRGPLRSGTSSQSDPADHFRELQIRLCSCNPRCHSCPSSPPLHHARKLQESVSSLGFRLFVLPCNPFLVRGNSNSSPSCNGPWDQESGHWRQTPHEPDERGRFVQTLEHDGGSRSRQPHQEYIFLHLLGLQERPRIPTTVQVCAARLRKYLCWPRHDT